MKFRKSHLLIIVIVIVAFLAYRNTSGYMTGMSGLNPFPVKTNISDSMFDNFFSRMTKLGPQLKCNPGSPDGFINQAGDISKTYRKGDKRHVMSSYYTGGLLPGGYCNDQESVKGAVNWKFEEDDKVYPILLGN
jgi:hypothetical protein